MIRDTETLDGILDSIRRFVNDALIPREHEVAETDEISPDIIETMRELCRSAWKIDPLMG